MGGNGKLAAFRAPHTDMSHGNHPQIRRIVRSSYAGVKIVTKVVFLGTGVASACMAGSISSMETVIMRAVPTKFRMQEM
jgi:hypothetical protein